MARSARRHRPQDRAHEPGGMLRAHGRLGCLLRAAWMAQELLSTFAEDLGEVTLRPGTGGVFRIEYQGELIWERKRDGGFPDVKTLKQIVRDRLDPARDLGHLDRPRPTGDDA